jgi:HK97 family phage prohead protease
VFNSLELKDFSENTGVVKFYYSIFGNVDLVGDIVQDGAFTKTLQENKSNIFHDRNHTDSVGKPLEFGQDDTGAWVVSQLALNTINGKDTFEQYKAGIVKGHSMEYNVIKSSNDSNGARLLNELRLWGVTTVTTVPANLLAQTISFKSYNDIQNEMNAISAFLNNSNISDECGQSFLNKYNELKALVAPLENRLKAVDTNTLSVIEPLPLITVNDIIKQLI